MIFEQVAPTAYSGEGFTRRTINDYVKCGENAGLKVKSLYLLSFNSHRFFERHIAKKYIKLFKDENDYEKRLRANSKTSYRLLSKIFLLFDYNPVRENVKSGWGNVLIVFERGY